MLDAKSPMPFGGMCHRTRRHREYDHKPHHVTNAFRRDVSSDNGVVRGAGWILTASPMPFGGMCHRTRSKCDAARTELRSPMPFGGMCHRTHRVRRHRRGDAEVTNAFRRDVSSDRRSPGLHRGESRVTNAFRRDVSSDPSRPSDPGCSPKSPMPFGGMCHRTASKLSLYSDFHSHQCLSAGCVIGPRHRQPTARCRPRHQCLSAGCVIGPLADSSATSALTGSPMPFGGMCHRTGASPHPRGTRRRSPMPFGGMCHRTTASFSS